MNSSKLTILAIDQRDGAEKVIVVTFFTFPFLDLGEVCGFSNETKGVLQIEENPCRTILGVHGEMIEMVPRAVRPFPFPISDTKHFVCQFPGEPIIKFNYADYFDW